MAMNFINFSPYNFEISRASHLYVHKVKLQWGTGVHSQKTTLQRKHARWIQSLVSIMCNQLHISKLHFLKGSNLELLKCNRTECWQTSLETRNCFASLSGISQKQNPPKVFVIQFLYSANIPSCSPGDRTRGCRQHGPRSPTATPALSQHS